MRLLNFCQKTIEYSFYLLFFLVPLAFTSDTSELFEFNKLWLTFILTIVIGTAWFTKMIIKKEFRIQKTPLDIPIGLFLLSQIISSFVSLDMHTSIWGYYSRFNGGLFSIFSYVFLFYAFVSNFRDSEDDKKEKEFDVKRIYLFLGTIVLFFGGTLISSLIKGSDTAGIPFQLFATTLTAVLSFVVFMKAAPVGVVKRSLYIIFSSAILVVLWGLPSHFGYDPTCLLFRGTFDVSCWTNDFQPRVRMFSTLGQPAWLAAYLVALLPISAAFFINFVKGKNLRNVKSINFLFALGYAVLFGAFYISLLYTQARSAIISFWIILPILAVLYLWYFVKPQFTVKKLHLDFKALTLVLLLTFGITFFAGQPFAQLNKLTLSGLKETFSKPAKTNQTPKKAETTTPVAPTVELGGTDSGKIRLLVWQGAIDIWKNNLVFGSGLETYAFAYYQYRPAAHNLTSEAKYLYNKAHNEYLNYLATTGTFGIIAYMSMIIGFLFISIKKLFKNRKKPTHTDFLVLSIIAGYGGILFTNFFGFSVVMINILFYLFPAFVFMLLGVINYDKSYKLPFAKSESSSLGNGQKISVIVVSIISIFMLYNLVTYWNADRQYYFGMNYDRAGDYQTAYNFLKKAIDTKPSEPVYKDEFAYNNAVLGSAILAQASQQKDNQEQNLAIAKQLIDSAVKMTNEVTAEHPNNIVFLKTKVRIFYTLGQVDTSYLPKALEAIKRTSELAPTDEDVSYNLGVLYGQTGNSQKAVETLQNTIKLKPDDSKVYYALGIFYHQLAVDENGKIVNQEFNKKAIDTMKLMIEKFGSNQQASDAIKAWGGSN
jgi:tetratricopeptide (TPR) repeat protein